MNDNEYTEGKRRLEEIGSRLGELFGKQGSGISGGGLFAGLGSLIEHLAKLAEHSDGARDVNSDKPIKGVYGFTVRTASAGDVKVEPFGNIKRNEAGKLVEVQHIREPMLDMFDEPDHLLIVAEVPGITQEDVRLELQDDILLFTAEHEECKYRKEVLLPASFQPDSMSFSCRNGLLEIRFNK